MSIKSHFLEVRDYDTFVKRELFSLSGCDAPYFNFRTIQTHLNDDYEYIEFVGTRNSERLQQKL